MCRRRWCPICGEYFRPHTRAGDRQKVCSKQECQRERHRRACRSWHQRNGHLEQEGRIREKIRGGAEKSDAAKINDNDEKLNAAERVREPMDEFAREVIRDAVGVKTYVVLDELCKVIFDHLFNLSYQVMLLEKMKKKRLL